MCIAPLTTEQLANTKKFQYKCTDASLLYNKCMSPCLNKCLIFVPECIAPNVITLFSLFMNILAACWTFFDSGFDFGHDLKHSTCLIIGCTQLLYQLLDNLDGKQARKTGSASPFGMLMDHGCDIFTNILTAFNVSHLLLVGTKDFLSFSVFCGLVMGFYMMTYEQYKIGEMHFAIVNGTDEGNISIFLMGVISGFIGQGWVKFVIISSWQLTIGKIIAIGILLGGISTVFQLYLHTLQKKKCYDLVINFLDGLVFYNVLLIPIIYVEFRNAFYQKYMWLILVNSMALFARVTLDMQVKIATIDTLSCNFMFIFSNVFYIISIFITNMNWNFYLLCALAAVQIAEMSMFIYLRADQITEYLGIKIFVISKMEQI